jgi:O-antigen biosynthesis protein
MSIKRQAKNIAKRVLGERLAKAAVKARDRNGIKLEIVWPAEPHLIASAAPVTQHKVALKSGQKPTIGFVIPPADIGSGGHTTIFRFVTYLEQKGYNCSIFIYDPLRRKQPGEATNIIRNHFFKMNATIHEKVKGMERMDVLFATNWCTAYPVVNCPAKNTKFYFVQDFEPWFDPVGSYSQFAENTYKYGLYGITAGRWLTERLSAEYGMECEFFNFGVDTDLYKDLGTRREDLCVYVRTGTPRRGFEMCALAAGELYKRNPKLRIHTYGGDKYRTGLPFKAIQHGICTHKELRDIYNQCRAALSFSFTNLSLTPQEILACGCIPVVNCADNTRKVFDNKYVAFVEPQVQDIVRVCEDILYNKDKSYFAEAAQNHGSTPWQNSWEKVEKFMLNKACR